MMMKLPSLLAAASVALLSASASVAAECRVGDCSFYNCVDNLVGCGPGGYPIGYGLKYCRRFTHAHGTFSPKGQQWVTETKVCLERHVKGYMNELETQGTSFPLTDGGCRKLRSHAMDSHVACYTGGSISVCSLPLSDWAKIMLAVHDAFGDAFLQTVKQSLLTLQECASVLGGVLSSSTYRFTTGTSIGRIFRRDSMPSDQSGNPSQSEVASPVSTTQVGDDVMGAAWRRRRQAARRLRKRLAAFLRIADSHVFVDVTRVGRAGDVYIDGPTHPMKDDDVHQLPTIDVAVHILDGDGRAHELAQMALAGVSDGAVFLEDTLPDDWQGSAVLIGAGAEAPLPGAAGASRTSATSDATTTSSSSSSARAFSGAQVAGIVVGTVVGTLVLASALILMALRMSKYRVVRSQAESDFLARSQEPLLEEQE